jgi:hypothetical protein
MEATMSDANDKQPAETQGAQEPPAKIRYPTNHVVAVIDKEVPLAAAVESLTSGGFLESEIHVTCGTTEADRLRASTGRGGLAHVAIRIAQQLGLEDDEMALKTTYEQAMRDGGYVVRVAAPTDERKERAADVLRKHGAHTINFLGRFTVEGMDRA